MIVGDALGNCQTGVWEGVPDCRKSLTKRYEYNKMLAEVNKKERNMSNISKSLEEYIKTMYVLYRQNGEIRVTDVAEKMSVSKASVNKAVKNLKEEGMLNYEAYGTIEFTERGEELAKKLLEAYDISFLFFKEVLNLDEEEARINAESLKCAITDEAFNGLARYVHKVLNLSNLNCAYDINNSKCRTCIKRTKSN